MKIRAWHRGAGAGLVLVLTLASSSCARTEAQPTKPSKITVWGSQETPQSVKTVLDAFEKKSGVEVEFVTIPGPFEENLLTKWTTGERPDAMFYQPAAQRILQLRPEDTLHDLTGKAYLSRTKNNLGAIAGTVRGKVYSATFGFPAVFGVFYNKKIFAQNNLSVPSTVGELQTVATTLRDAGVTPYGIAGGDSWTTQIPPLEAMTDSVDAGIVQDINSKKATWTDPRLVASIQSLQDQVDQKLVNADYKSAKFTDQTTQVVTGKVAMIQQGSWSIPGMAEAAKDSLDETIGFFPYPSESGKVQFQTSNLGSIQLPKTGDAVREATAQDLVEFMTGDGYSIYVTAALEPSIMTGVANPSGLSELYASVEASFASGGVSSVAQQQAVGFGDFPTYLNEMINGKRDPASVADQLNQEFLKNAKLAGLEGF